MRERGRRNIERDRQTDRVMWSGVKGVLNVVMLVRSARHHNAALDNKTLIICASPSSSVSSSSPYQDDDGGMESATWSAFASQSVHHKPNRVAK